LILSNTETMKMLVYFLLVLFIISCNKDEKSETIQSDDLSASSNMTSELSFIQQALTNLISAQTANQRRHWDSVYHHHDSLFWHHHSIYHHNTYVHDDHSHSWTPYDPAINHSHHYHHSYPGHLNDSLLTTPNDHHHTDCNHHPGHHICHHHTLDSLHTIHNLHHP